MNLRDLTERYRLGDEIGRGSIGVIYRADDLVLDRSVAVKVLRPELINHRRHRPRFLREALLCARLGHPNIVPVFDVGAMDVGEQDGVPCLVMGLLAGRSLRTIIRSGRHGVARVLGWFVQVCHGIAFAHDQGVIHRDIKPAHIFVGDFGQVVLTDWGLAKHRTPQAEEQPSPTSREVTRVGDVVGTPAYMAPEQASGRLGEVDHHADIYALGAILYEILTGTRPYEASRSIDVLRALRKGPAEPPRERAPHRNIPSALEALCLQAMAREPADRFESALDLAANIEAHFDTRSTAGAPIDRLSDPGHDESEATATRTAAAGASMHLLAEGRAESAAFARQLDEAGTITAEAARRSAALPWDILPSARHEVWRLERRARETREQAAFHLGQAVDSLQNAGVDGESAGAARESLARLHRDAWLAAEDDGDVVSAFFHRARAASLDVGELASELAGRATLTVTSDPAGAAVSLGTIDDVGPIWQRGAEVRVGTTPLSGRTLSATRLVLRLTTPDGLNTRLPLKLRPGESRVIEVAMPPARQVPPGFVFIAGGPFVVGADDHAPGAAPPRDIDVGSFCISRHPVTWEEYFEFLEDVLAVGGDAERHFPRHRGDAMVAVVDHRVQWKEKVDAPRGAPVRYVSLADAEAYAVWLGRRLGMPIRLPTEDEWEYAAGAADGRSYPWGRQFVQGLGDTRRRGVRGPAAVNTFTADESPFGMREVSGGVREWTATQADDPERQIIRGGSWRAYPDQCRIGARATGKVDLTHQTIGIRLAADVPG